MCMRNLNSILEKLHALVVLVTFEPLYSQQLFPINIHLLIFTKTRQIIFVDFENKIINCPLPVATVLDVPKMISVFEKSTIDGASGNGKKKAKCFIGCRLAFSVNKNFY